ncbi:hypothetical protein M419DRAFT_11347 [Trichoderma reesei RUT C-30]|uniref:Uncharacterized protein n=1 Tax=Hypocrea jecorina (strain ATCC 56765 / BCRC 32924 / NRRL 11460 / Rut C-30) TaxID=1344414 RepID=A0A024S3Z8_HYPJR|nr:hypothetical protein M419DRAFT_11347 [Trichoderma reesei RUT C-30]
MPANGTRSAQQFVPPRLAGPMHSTAPCPYQQAMSNAHQRTYQRRSLGARGDASLPWPARRYRPAPPHCVSRQVRSLLPPRAKTRSTSDPAVLIGRRRRWNRRCGRLLAH